MIPVYLLKQPSAVVVNKHGVCISGGVKTINENNKFFTLEVTIFEVEGRFYEEFGYTIGTSGFSGPAMPSSFHYHNSVKEATLWCIDRVLDHLGDKIKSENTKSDSIRHEKFLSYLKTKRKSFL